ncbi:porin [Accumulibacter sp.]|uniref:porin n=1 Tax=Accumulibacter sp. TaxID=2053492 RepID=UPI0025CF0334|nr:porin [Accumulibacter sp.]MCM8626420.1 porin [Accumulibacter sp.]
MQKKLIALAVAGLASGAAVAQTNVTLYGIADLGYVYSKGDNGLPGGTNPPILAIGGSNQFSGIQSGLLSGSRIGFKGEEALGNGLKAIFTLEYGITPDTNSGIGNASYGPNARQTFVGLAHNNWGSLTLGRQYSPGYQATANNDPAAGAAFEPQSYLSAQGGNTITPNNAARWNNAIAYTSPNWGGFSAKAIYGFGETANANGTFSSQTCDPAAAPAGACAGTNPDVNGKWAVGFNFASGPFNADLVYQQRGLVTGGSILSTPGFAVFGANGQNINEWYVGASYDFKVVKIMGSYQAQNDKNAVNLDNQLWSIGAVIPVLGNSNIHLAYAQLMWDGGHLLGRDWLVNNNDSAMIAWTTNLSKRTTFYAGYVWNGNDNWALNAGPVAGVGAVNQDNNTFLAGLRHTF